MFLHDRPLENLDKKIYRFALFGLSGSGKTCILTAMGMVCRPTTDGSCCSPLPAYRYASSEVQDGWKILQEYVLSLGKEGELPKPNEVKWGTYPRYRYKYTDSKIGAIDFEIINYAVGSVHHRQFRNEDSAELLKHFTDHNVDGIIVLISVPKEDQEQSDIPDEIATLQAAVFSFIKGGGTARHRYPVALVLTKWDRQWERGVPIPPNGADVEVERLTKFMEQHVAYQEVHNLLKGSTDGGFKAFPVSALGLCSNDDKPNKLPLESYGLPFVFSWLIQSANDADFRRFEKMQSELPWWQFRPRLPLVLEKNVPAWVISPWKKWEQPVQETWSLAKSLLKRSPETKEWEDKRVSVQSAKKRLISILWIQILITAVVLFALPPVGIRVYKAWMLLNEADERKDQRYYERVQEHRTRAACDDYLNNAPIQTMGLVVRRYRAYIDEMAGEVNLIVTATLSVGNRIFWGGGSSNEFRLVVNDVQKIIIDDLNQLGFNSNKTLVLDHNRFPIEGKLTDTFNVNVEMLYNNVRKREQGSGSKSFTIRDLQQSQSLTLTSKNDTSIIHTLTLNADGFPAEPELPEWRSLSDESNK